MSTGGGVNFCSIDFKIVSIFLFVFKYFIFSLLKLQTITIIFESINLIVILFESSPFNIYGVEKNKQITAAGAIKIQIR